MPFRFLRPVHVALLAVFILCGAQVRLEDCRFDFHNFVCTYPAATYHIRLPDDRAPGVQIPVVVFLHDAGQSGAQVLENDALLQTFLEAGYAVIAPDALPRKNRRLEYGGEGRGLVWGESGDIIPADFSVKKFLVETRAGGTRLLDFGVDRGWYFYATDQIIYRDPRHPRPIGERRSEYIGRDEIQMLRDVLTDAAADFGTAQKPELILGLGHGGSLAWQIACSAPELAGLFAPVGGAFWRAVPAECSPGARVLHTHERASVFWPITGTLGGERRYARTKIRDNIDMMLDANWCSGEEKTGRRGNSSAHLTTWDNCVDGGPVELLVLDRRFAFQDWWLKELLGRIGPVQDAPAVEQVEPDTRKPVFKRPGSDAGSLFKHPRAPSTN
jgi:polyhydroxybutyrate depolymerase